MIIFWKIIKAFTKIKFKNIYKLKVIYLDAININYSLIVKKENIQFITL